jgi:hypothetical protein
MGLVDEPDQRVASVSGFVVDSGSMHPHGVDGGDECVMAATLRESASWQTRWVAEVYGEDT